LSGCTCKTVNEWNKFVEAVKAWPSSKFEDMACIYWKAKEND